MPKDVLEAWDAATGRDGADADKMDEWLEMESQASWIQQLMCAYPGMTFSMKREILLVPHCGYYRCESVYNMDQAEKIMLTGPLLDMTLALTRDELTMEAVQAVLDVGWDLNRYYWSSARFCDMCQECYPVHHYGSALSRACRAGAFRSILVLLDVPGIDVQQALLMLKQWWCVRSAPREVTECMVRIATHASFRRDGFPRTLQIVTGIEEWGDESGDLDSDLDDTQPLMHVLKLVDDVPLDMDLVDQDDFPWFFLSYKRMVKFCEEVLACRRRFSAVRKQWLWCSVKSK